MKKELTERQKDILEFIRQNASLNGYPPTYREIGKRFGIASTFGVKRHIDALIKKGYITSESNASRAISITNIEDFSKSKGLESSASEIPVVGRVAAGYPILAEQNIEGNIIIDRNITSNPENCFGLKVRGDSMINAGILEGDIVIVNQQKYVKNGDVIVAMIEDEATLKRYQNKNNKVILIPENDNYNPIVIKNTESFSIVGKVVGVFRYYN
ncbi:MAG: transcriptional repressor LexA [Melioribacteraceae bacterium]|nr:transcriptional repressor LexA [Melioribacteraceae bacterium]MCF8354930.1 transcriptional repressor LexA [Melioribacteraceae bacterium]MCF8392381.1 transcriptional repressor LexA [Melioribacteraceae bacterium]MCF8417902.1 transcriptional repressor LexA [Melioribacteraceae bacterium]